MTWLLGVADFDRLLDARLIPVSKVPLTKGRKNSKRGKIAVETSEKKPSSQETELRCPASSWPSTALLV